MAGTGETSVCFWLFGLMVLRLNPVGQGIEASESGLNRLTKGPT